ncbi:MAG: ABC transporter permease, partial [Acidimicrobiales bacterium]
MTPAPPATVPTGTGRPRPELRRASFFDVVRSEWTKLRTVRSTWYTLAATAVLAIGIGALIAAAASGQFDKASPSTRASWDPTAISDSGVALAQIAIAVLGVLSITAEYSTGMIRSSLLAVPRRVRVLVAKVLVFAVVGVVVGEVLCFVSFYLGQALIQNNGAPYVHLGDPQVLRAVIGSGLYLAALGLLGMALGFLVRNTALSIVLVVVIAFVLPSVGAALPTNLRHSFEKFWPTQAGGQVGNVYRAAHTLSPWVGFLELCLVILVLLVGGALLL